MPNCHFIDSPQALGLANTACNNPIWVRTEDELNDAIVNWQQHTSLGLDTEFIRERTYYPQLALIQISNGRQVWLLDSVTLPDHRTLSAIFTNPNITIILHSPREDLEVLRLAVGTVPQRLFDTQAAAALCGLPLQSSYSGLLNEMLQLELDKEMTRSDWLQRPLSESQVIYACRDVAYLPLLAQLLQQRLETMNRWQWFTEDMRWLLHDSQQNAPPERLYTQIPGAGRLAPSALSALQLLCQWRDQQARDSDLPRQFVVRNEALIQLAERLPEDHAALHRINALHPSQKRRYGDAILQQLSAAQGQPAPPPILHLDKLRQQRIKRAQKWLRATAETLQLEPAVLASRRELERWVKEGLNHPPTRLQGWRWPLIGAHLRQIFEDST